MRRGGRGKTRGELVEFESTIKLSNGRPFQPSLGRVWVLKPRWAMGEG